MSDRAGKFTIETKKRILYSDFLMNFDINPFTGILARSTNEESVKNALKQLILTDCGERFYDSNKGSRIKQTLFELFDIGLYDAMKMQIKSTCAQYEPRALIQDVQIDRGPDNNEFTVSITFGIVNIPDQYYSISVAVNRVR